MATAQPVVIAGPSGARLYGGLFAPPTLLGGAVLADLAAGGSMSGGASLSGAAAVADAGASGAAAGGSTLAGNAAAGDASADGVLSVVDPNSVDFTTATIEDPLSVGGTWSNNTQGVGGNVAPGNLGSMRVALATDGVTKIAQHAANPVIDYDDSFAFKPGIGAGNLRIIATVYRSAGYNPTANHELELIIGCATTSGGNHRWAECLWSDSGIDIVNLDGQPNAFTAMGGATGLVTGGPQNGNVWVAEFYRTAANGQAANTVRWLVNGVVACAVTSGIFASLSTGCGIAAFRRGPTFGTSASGGMGFRNFRCEAF